MKFHSNHTSYSDRKAATIVISGRQKKIMASVNGDLKVLDSPQIFVNDTYYANGIGVYETLRLREGRLYFLEEHIKRLRHSAEIIGITRLPDPDEVTRYLNDLIRVNRLVRCNIKVMLIKSSAGSNMYMYPVDIPAVKGNDNPDFPEPVGLEVAAYMGERHFPQAKSLSMLLSSRALDHARDFGCWDSILIDRQGLMLEGSRANLYWLEEDGIYSPPEDSILSGVTRINFQKSLEEHGVMLKQGMLGYDDFLAKPRPLLMTSTSIAVQPVTSFVDIEGISRVLPEDPRTERFARWYGEYLRKYARRLKDE